MRAPRWVEAFCAWRWAPCVALIAGALLFIALVLLLIPQQLEPAARPAEAARAFDALADPPQRVVSERRPKPLLAPSPPAAENPPSPRRPH